MAELPYQAEYAKTGRAACKGCKQKIDQGTLRIAVMVQSAFHDGKQPNWHHEECFFQKQRPTTYTDISNFNKLKPADQLRVKAEIEKNCGIVMPEEPKGKKKGKKRAADNGVASNAAIKDFRVEYAKSSRATCRRCEIKICKDEVRICKVVFDTEVGSKYGGQPLWHHVKCFAEERSSLLYFAGGESLPGIKTLSKEDQKMIMDEIKPFKIDEVPVKKLKEEPKDAAELKEEKEKTKTILKQNKLYQKYKSSLSDLKKKDFAELLKENSQEVPGGRDECMDRIADMMAFGALEPCPECKQGQLVLDNYGYKCTGNISDWTKCSYVTQTPERRPMIISKGLKENSIFKKFNSKVTVRLFEVAARPINVFVKKEEPGSSQETKNIPIPPLKNLQFFIYGRLKDKENVKKRILKLGGLVVSKLTDTLVAVVSTKKDVERMSDKMQEIQEKEFEVVEPSFLDLIDTEKGTISNTLQLVKENNIAEWGSDPATRLPQDVLDGKSIPKSGSNYASTKSSSMKLKIKGGTAVDPDSGLEDIASVYRDYEGTKYTVVLCQTDVVAQKNSYYKLQVLQQDDKKNWWLFRSWGRIGTTIGGNKLDDFRSADQAVYEFERCYMEKTENPWNCRHTFQKIPGRYYPLDVDYGEGDADDADKLQIDKNCKLAMPVQKLMTTIFDINFMKKTLLEFDLDTEKMPLGKLSKKQIKSGYKVLAEVLKYLEQGNASQSKIIDATNRFFTLVPHDFGRNNAPLLDDVELIKKKTEMLDNMLEIEIAYSLLKSDSDDTSSPIESHYKKLKTEIVPLDRDSDEFKMLQEYTRNTHAQTHSSYTMDIEQVFKVVREGEDKRYKPFKKLHNRKLLWHGSRLTNFAGILSQGLRIAPPEAPVTGYMFGKGIYFADMVSKSANYCCTSKARPTGLMLLCEVALGDMKICHSAENVKLSTHQHSAWGVGRTQPDPAMDRPLPCGTVVPLGTPVDTHSNSSLLYNEFIVYDVGQVNVKYLLQMKFNHKY